MTTETNAQTPTMAELSRLANGTRWDVLKITLQNVIDGRAELDRFQVATIYECLSLAQRGLTAAESALAELRAKVTLRDGRVANAWIDDNETVMYDVPGKGLFIGSLRQPWDIVRETQARAEALQSRLDAAERDARSVREAIIEDADAMRMQRDDALIKLAKVMEGLRETYEIYAGMEGIPLPKFASEAYLLRIIDQMQKSVTALLRGEGSFDDLVDKELSK